jgi:HK97 family phage prohead protease
MSEQPSGELWHRAAELVAVRFPDRMIELIVIPYERAAVVPYQGRMCTEIISRGSFDGIERRANRIRVNRDHQVERTVGRAVAFHPSRSEGLVAEIKVARTPLGDETLELAEDGCLDASAGFLPFPGGMVWEERSRYRVNKAWLGHIAMSPEPIYEDAAVLAVRHREPPTASKTPNLDQVRAWRLEALVASDSALNRPT